MPTLDRTRVRRHLKDRDYIRLFTEEMGWDHATAAYKVEVGDRSYDLETVAEKRGVQALLCRSDPMPGSSVRRAIERRLTHQAYQHIVIYAPEHGERQVWQWSTRQLNQPVRTREKEYADDDSHGESLVQSLEQISFTLDDEDGLTHMDVLGRLQPITDAAPVTKRFYDRFKTERDALRKMVQGIPDSDMADWYVAVTLNRLMFIYFVQKKGFLNGDPAYLATRLSEWRTRGTDRYYREFLCPLFFRGFALPREARTPQDRALLGDVPYLNGGIFAQHELEQRYGQAIQIPDAAFERIYRFFDDFTWHLDERPLRADNEINPDVLGYIFEKYVNQKQMGAYYTKEDITGYINRNTVLPHLLDKAREACSVAFEPSGPVWRLLSEDPDRYIWPAVRHGCELPLPEEIQAGVNPPTLHNIVGEGPVATLEARKAWNRPAPEEYGLPTEIWRETVARRQRYEELWTKLVSGEIHEVNDLITWNLDIAQFCQDVVENCEGADLLRAFWSALTGMTVLDPTCGSGAFLFAALNLLEPLYEACLDRMAGFLDEWERAGARSGGRHPNYAREFRAVLDEVARHPNRRYYVLKSIIVRNLYGVDIMEEAVEICRLRLFLKLVAQVEEAEHIEPLPDIDFNIRAGNTLVGFTSLKEVEEALTLERADVGAVKAAQGVIMGTRPEEDRALAEVKEQAEIAGRAYALFQDSQVVDGKITPAAKAELQARLETLDARLDAALAHTYGVNPAHQDAYARWCASHKPFHWLTAFYGIMQRGGFDVIIGNPPYVEYAKVKPYYTVNGYHTEDCGNLYALVLERCARLAGRGSYSSMIVPLSSICTEGFAELQEFLMARSSYLWVSTYDTIPCTLFTGVVQRLTILVCKYGQELCAAFTTRYRKWFASARQALFSTLDYGQLVQSAVPGSLAKTGGRIDAAVVRRLAAREPCRVHLMLRAPSDWPNGFWYKRRWSYYLFFVDFMPEIRDSAGCLRAPSEFKHIAVRREMDYRVLLSTYNSSTFYSFFTVFSDNRNVNLRELQFFPLGHPSPQTVSSLRQLSDNLMLDMQTNSEMRTCTYRSIGTIRNQYFFQGRSKPIIDEIDTVLARHYGFTEEELDFIINYDIKYRMGDALGSEEDGEG